MKYFLKYFTVKKALFLQHYMLECRHGNGHRDRPVACRWQSIGLNLRQSKEFKLLLPFLSSLQNSVAVLFSEGPL